MIFQYAAYNAVEYTGDDALAKRLSPELRAEILPQTDVCIDLAKSEGVRAIDHAYNIPRSREITKSIVTEVTSDELDAFEYYHATCAGVFCGQELKATIKRPHECCFAGATLHPPFVLQRKKSLNKDVMVVVCGPVHQSYLVISEKLRVLFEQTGITGLTFMAMDPPTAGEKRFVAMVEQRVSVAAGGVKVKSWHCRRHKYAELAYIFDEQPVDLSGQPDFVMLDRINVKGWLGTRTYLRFPVLLISCRVVKLLLGNGCTGFESTSYYLKNGYSAFTAG